MHRIKKALKLTKLWAVSSVGRGMDGWMNGVLGHFYALSRLNWAGDNLGQWGGGGKDGSRLGEDSSNITGQMFSKILCCNANCMCTIIHG